MRLGNSAVNKLKRNGIFSNYSNVDPSLSEFQDEPAKVESKVETEERQQVPQPTEIVSQLKQNHNNKLPGGGLIIPKDILRKRAAASGADFEPDTKEEEEEEKPSKPPAATLSSFKDLPPVPPAKPKDLVFDNNYTVTSQPISEKSPLVAPKTTQPPPPRTTSGKYTGPPPRTSSAKYSKPTPKPDYSREESGCSCNLL